MGRPDAEIETVMNHAMMKTSNEIDLSTEIPLWFYVLTEAEMMGKEAQADRFEPEEGLGLVGAVWLQKYWLGLMNDHLWQSIELGA